MAAVKARNETVTLYVVIEKSERFRLKRIMSQHHILAVGKNLSLGVEIVWLIYDGFHCLLPANPFLVQLFEFAQDPRSILIRDLDVFRLLHLGDDSVMMW